MDTKMIAAVKFILEDEGVPVETLRSLGEIVGVAGSRGTLALTALFISAKLLQFQKTARRSGDEGRPRCIRVGRKHGKQDPLHAFV